MLKRRAIDEELFNSRPGSFASLLCALASAESAESAKLSIIEDKFQKFDSLVASVLDKPDAEKASAAKRSYQELFGNEAARSEANRSAAARIVSAPAP